jgi:hypothetical protein
MENAPTQNSNESAPDKRDYIPGTFPKHHYTVTSAVLAGLLESYTFTGMESVFQQSTTRLSAVVHYLGRKYNWSIERRDIVTGTNDGRTTWITQYWLPQETIANAFEMGARDFIEKVKTARVKQRQQAGKCKSEAARINAMLRRQDPRQSGLWGDL